MFRWDTDFNAFTSRLCKFHGYNFLGIRPRIENFHCKSPVNLSHFINEPRGSLRHELLHSPKFSQNEFGYSTCKMSQSINNTTLMNSAKAFIYLRYRTSPRRLNITPVIVNPIVIGFSQKSGLAVCSYREPILLFHLSPILQLI